MTWLWIIGGGVVLVFFIYWTIVIGEGTYFGAPVVRFIYQRGAGIYDDVRRHITASDGLHLVEPLQVAVLQMVDAPALDVGTGTGRVPLLLAQFDWYSGAIIGLDLTPAMLRQAQCNAAAHNVAERITWVCGSGDDLRRWSAATFGLVTCLEAVEYFPRPRQAISEMWRVLRPNGTLLISVWMPGHARWLPGKAWTSVRLTRLLHHWGCTEVVTRDWQPDYELVIARKPALDAATHRHG